MADATLELIVHSTTLSTMQLDIKNHVVNRIERFIYQNTIGDESVPLVYLENEPIDSRTHLQVVNKSYAIPANSMDRIRDPNNWDKFTGSAYTSQYDFGLITNRVVIDQEGKERPLFYRHDLLENTTSCDIYSIEDGNKISVDVGYEIDLDNGKLFTNYRNWFDPDTGSYKIFMVSCASSDGTTEDVLLDPKPVAKEADWQDIDLTTGQMKTGYPLYTKSRSSGTTFYMNEADTWYFKPTGRSILKPIRPTGTEPDDPWYMKFGNGIVSAVANGAARTYRISEFYQQPFIPYAPIVYSTYSRMLKVNRNVLAATRDSLKIDLDEGLHLELQIYSPNGELLRVLHTDTSKEGDRFSNTDIFYETDKIASWDNENGFVALGIDIHASWEVRAKYYYEAIDYEYKLVSLNPMQNRKMRDHTAVFYVVPDVNDLDRSIHHLLVDQDGYIVECSQGPDGIDYKNLQLLDSGGAYNSDTVIGLQYNSALIADNFTTRHTVGYGNDDAYLVLAECAFAERSLPSDQVVIDVRRRGDFPRLETYESTLLKNPRILQSIYGYGEDGQEIPENAVMIVEAPLSLLEDYGGNLTKEQAEDLLRTNMPSAGYALIDWVYPKAEITSIESTVAGQVDLEWTWEGPSQTYKVYRLENLTGPETLVDTQVDPAEGTLSYSDTLLDSDKVFYYRVTITEDGVEYPASNTFSVRTA